MNAYIPKVAKIIDLIKHTEKEWTFRVECDTKDVLPGKFFEISMPKYGESPISVSGYGENYVDFTIREEEIKLNLYWLDAEKVLETVSV